MNKYIQRLKNVTLASIFTLIICSCSSNETRYVESGGPRSVVTTHKINIADWNNAASSLLSDMLSSGAIDKTGLTQPVKMKVITPTNNTSDIINTELLTKQICIDLNNSGKVSAISEDNYTQDLARYEAKIQNKDLSLPKFTLTGSIIEDRDSNSNLKEVTYVFFLELNYIGKPIWAGQKQITKQSSRSAFGF